MFDPSDAASLCALLAFVGLLSIYCFSDPVVSDQRSRYLAAVCTENLIRVDDAMESPKLVE
jgi:hypothetical protein